MFGAAGMLVRHRTAAGAEFLLMQRRSWWSHHGGTWGLLGGARLPAETAEQAAGREAWEEASVPASAYVVTGSFVDDHGGWSYTTVFGWAGELFEPGALNAESDEVAWVRRAELGELRLHPGFAFSWPSVAALLA